jgi:hypothetical protein
MGLANTQANGTIRGRRVKTAETDLIMVGLAGSMVLTSPLEPAMPDFLFDFLSAH